MNDLEFVGDYRQPQLNARQRELGFDGHSDGEFTFGDFLDIINPLQHIPVISSLYREITGDTISPHARVIGDTLFGGPSGLVSGLVNTIYSEINGEDIGASVIAMFTGGSNASDPQFAGVQDQASVTAGAAQPAAAGAELPLAAPLTTAAGPLATPPPVVKQENPRRTAQPAPEPTAAAAQPLPEGLSTAGSDSGLLTGQAAMSALFNDLRGNRPSTPAQAERPDTIALPRPQDAGTMKSYPLPPRRARAATAAPVSPTTPNAALPPETAAASAADHPLIYAQDMPEAAMAERMMQALDKYGQLTRQRQAEPAEAEPRWTSDPVE